MHYMATFVFNLSQKKKTKPAEKQIELIRHSEIKEQNEYYSYVDNDGNEKKFSGIIVEKDGSYVGKTVMNHKVILTYHPEVKAVEGREEYFSYLNDEGKEIRFVGKPEYDLENNSYFGFIDNVSSTEEIIDIFKEN